MNQTSINQIPIVISGRNGRMAHLIAGAVEKADDLSLAAWISPTRCMDHAQHPVLSDLSEVSVPDPVVIDFTASTRTSWLIDAAEKTPCSLIIGTSGIDDDLEARIGQLSVRRAVLRAANMSIGMMVMRETARRLAGVGGPGWEASVLDLHFRGKVEAISATALAIADDWNRARTPNTAPVSLASFRQGDGVSEHRLICHGQGEVFEISHRIDDRAAFLEPICNAARFLHGRTSGLYSLEDIL